jgi:DNA-binding MarR family transcriptional regulator
MSISRAFSGESPARIRSGPNTGSPQKMRPRSGVRRRPRAAAGYALPLTVSRGALIEDGSDRRFRTLVYDLLTISTRMEAVREHHGRRMGISGPQYSVLIAVGHLQGAHGASVGAVAQALHVSSAFIAAETGKLARRRLVLKRVNPRDRRGVLLSLTPAGRLAIDRASGEIRAINDLFFGALDRASFDAVCAAATALVEGSRKALHHLSAIEDDARAALGAAG